MLSGLFAAVSQFSPLGPRVCSLWPIFLIFQCYSGSVFLAAWVQTVLHPSIHPLAHPANVPQPNEYSLNMRTVPDAEDTAADEVGA